MMDSEIKELRKRKTKRILILTVGIIAVAGLISIITILTLMGGSSS